MSPEDFLEDLKQKPESLGRLFDALGERNPWANIAQPERIVFLGMGSSAYAAQVAAARLRARGLTAVAELASSDLLPQWGPGTLVVPISATGSSTETLDAVDRTNSSAHLVALTNTADSELSSRAGQTIDLMAGREAGGVACRTFQHTLALLLALETHLVGESLDKLCATVEKSIGATSHLLSTYDTWGPEASELLLGPDGTHVVAPARRFSSAQQSALMLREGPRRFAVGCEAGDWAHVDVYLSKNTDYRLLSYAGSSWDDGILYWTLPRDTTVVSVGGELEGARLTLRYPYDNDDDVRLLTETLVAELLAAEAWNAQPQ